MTATPPDPLATQHGSTPDPDPQAPLDEQTLRLQEENRALRELLAAQAQAALPSHRPGPLRRMCWWLISAPGAALVGWRTLLGRDGGRPITGKRVGYATLTVLYTLAIYGALVLLVVSWNSPNTARSGAAAAGPVRVPLLPWVPSPPTGDDAHQPPEADPSPAAAPGPGPSAVTQPEPVPAEAPTVSASPPEHTAMPGSPAPQSTLRVTEISAQDPLSWVDALKNELARCAQLGFFERPDCAWRAREQFCEPHRAWGTVRECPSRP